MITAQLLVNYLYDKICRLEDFCVMIVDEAHHTKKDHPYNNIMQQFYSKVETKYRPLVLGLSASPASGASYSDTVKGLDTIRNNLSVERILTPYITMKELSKAVNKTDLTFLTVQPQSQVTPSELMS